MSEAEAELSPQSSLDDESLPEVNAEIVETEADDSEVEGRRELSGVELRGAVEALVFVADEPISVKVIAGVLKVERDAVSAILENLAEDLNTREGGLQLREIGGGWQIATRPEYHEHVRA